MVWKFTSTSLNSNEITKYGSISMRNEVIYLGYFDSIVITSQPNKIIFWFWVCNCILICMEDEHYEYFPCENCKNGKKKHSAISLFSCELLPLGRCMFCSDLNTNTFLWDNKNRATFFSFSYNNDLSQRPIQFHFCSVPFSFVFSSFCMCM